MSKLQCEKKTDRTKSYELILSYQKDEFIGMWGGVEFIIDDSYVCEVIQNAQMELVWQVQTSDSNSMHGIPKLDSSVYV